VAYFLDHRVPVINKQTFVLIGPHYICIASCGILLARIVYEDENIIVTHKADCRFYFCALFFLHCVIEHFCSLPDAWPPYSG